MTVGHAQMRHPIQRCHLEKEFRGLLREAAGPQGRSKDRLVAKEGRLSETAPMIARVLFPAAAALLSDRPQVLIPLPRGARAVPMLPDLGVAPRRNHGRGAALSQGIVTLALVIGPIGTHLVDLS